MFVFVLLLAWPPVNKMYVLYLIYHEKNPQYQIISHLIDIQIIKNDFFFIDIIHYPLFSYRSLAITQYSKYPE